MLSEDTIRRAVKIAPGWKWQDNHVTFGAVYLGHTNDARSAPEFRTIMLDALAAALVAAVPYAVTIGPTYIGIRDVKEIGLPVIYERTFIGNRTENTIIAIVEFADKHPEVFK